EHGAEGEGERLVVLQPWGAAAARHVVGYGVRETALGGEGAVGVPLVLRSPEARVDEDGEFVETGGQGGVEAQVLAQLLGAVGELGATQEHREGAADATARASRDGIVHALLRVGHSLFGKIGKASRGRLGAHDAGEAEQRSTDGHGDGDAEHGRSPLQEQYHRARGSARVIWYAAPFPSPEVSMGQRIRRSLTILTCFAVAAALAAAVPALAQEKPRSGGELIFVGAAEPPGFDGHREETFGMLHPVGPHYSTLMRVDPTDKTGTKFVGDLAESWTVSPDKRTYTF